MKRLFVKIMIAVLLCTVLPILFSDTVCAKYFVYTPEEESTADPDELYGNFEEAVPDDIRSRAGNVFSPDAADKLLSETGEFLAQTLCEKLMPSLGTLSVLLGAVLLASLYRLMQTPLGSSKLLPLYSYIVRGAIVLTVMRTQDGVINALCDYSSRLCSMMNAFIPAISAVYLSSGSVTSAAVSSSAFAVLVTLAQNLLSSLLLPAVRIAFVLSAVSCMTGQKNAQAVAASLRSFAGFVCALSMSVFSFVFSLRLNVGNAADGAAMRTVQFAVGSFVPIVGGAVSESMTQLAASLSFIKTVCGTGAIICVVLLVVPTLVTLVLNRAVMFICKYVSLSVSPDGEGALFSELGSNVTLLIAFALSEAVMFIAAFTMFVRSSLAMRG